MREKSTWEALSILCLVQLILCVGIVVGVLVFRCIGGSVYEGARQWYQEAAGDTILVFPADPSQQENA